MGQIDSFSFSPLPSKAISGAHSSVNSKIDTSYIRSRVAEQIHQAACQILRLPNSLHRRRFLEVMCNFWTNFCKVQVQVRLDISKKCALAETSFDILRGRLQEGSLPWTYTIDPDSSRCNLMGKLHSKRLYEAFAATVRSKHVAWTISRSRARSHHHDASTPRIAFLTLR